MKSSVNGLSASTRLTGHLSNFQGGSSAESGSTSAFSTASTKVSWIAELATIFKSSIESIMQHCKPCFSIDHAAMVLQSKFSMYFTFGRNAYRHKCLHTPTHTHTYYSPDNSQHLTVESCVLEALSWSSPAVFSWKRLKSGKIDRFSQSKPKPSEAITNELQSSFQCDKDMPGKGLALSIQTASIRTIQTHRHTH